MYTVHRKTLSLYEYYKRKRELPKVVSYLLFLNDDKSTPFNFSYVNSEVVT